MKNTRRIISVIIALVTVLSLAFSTAFIIEEADHNCVGEECHICHQLSSCLNAFSNVVKNTGSASVTCIVLLLALIVSGIVRCAEKEATLVSLKVKLSN
ncbi:MAG TPA: hypothetical protein DCR23_00120 [Ruminococcaceae bacterium]|nr:hypothetical protein [Oscillospiraceae bacterium]